MTIQESQLLRRERFEELFIQTAPSVLAFARRRVSSSEADDVLAETFLIAWRRLADLPDEPLPWLYGAARRVIANQRRSTQRRKDLDIRLRTGVRDASEPVDSSEVLEALGRLGEADRYALTLTAWEGLGSKEAAVVLGCSYAAFRVRLARARRRLARELGGSAGGLSSVSANGAGRPVGSA
jgi:RNA polymerase sigma-70 factor, ECF subfamily